MGMLRETLLIAIARELADRPMHIGTVTDAIAPAAYGELVVRFSAVDPAVGDASVWIADERFDLVSWNRDTRHNSRAAHPGWPRCSSFRYAQYLHSSRLASRARRSATYATYHGSRPLGGLVSAAVFVGDVMHDTFDSFDTHLPAPERAARVAGEVVRFLRELFEDRLLMWVSVDGRKCAWRERGHAGHLEPLVLDDTTYHRYLWSGALPLWRATDAILARGRIADDHEHHLVRQRLDDTGARGVRRASRGPRAPARGRVSQQ
jgi:hypothetical protein